MASGDENFPVPMMSRERNFRPAMTNDWLADDMASNLGNNAGLSSSEAGFGSNFRRGFRMEHALQGLQQHGPGERFGQVGIAQHTQIGGQAQLFVEGI